MTKRCGVLLGAVGLAIVFAAGGPAWAGHTADHPKKHKVVYHFNGSDSGDHMKKAIAVLGNIQNHVKGVGGWKNIEELVLVTHGEGIVPFVEKNMDPELRKRFDILNVSGMKLGVCGNTLKAKKINIKEYRDGSMQLDQGGVVAIAEYQEKGYAYIKP
jgi:intracellular sulfur oxidation DsrE/DsrF family protein